MDRLRRIVRPRDARPKGAEYLAPYEIAAKRHGPSFEATLWASREAQRERFRVIADMADLSGRVLLDAGSGCGDLALHLREAAVVLARYIGLEGVASVAPAACSCAVPGAEFIQADFVADHSVFARLRPDVVVFSGSLNTLDQPDALAVLDRAWAAVRGAPCLAEGRSAALVFNFLSDRCSERLRRQDSSPARRFDTAAMLGWALDRATGVRFRQDYLPEGHDATICMRVDERAAR
ncbi:MAG: class I SAM-dependent methyltransferase [Phycisphaerales bacterium]|nr:class I SAM-dependent methyltransferase [Phycisphaerales bacterium]